MLRKHAPALMERAVRMKNALALADAVLMAFADVPKESVGRIVIAINNMRIFF